MNEKSNPMPMMYKTIPAVAELNKVPGFEPVSIVPLPLIRSLHSAGRWTPMWTL